MRGHANAVIANGDSASIFVDVYVNVKFFFAFNQAIVRY